MKRCKLLLLNFLCFACITATLTFSPITGKLLTALSYILHYFVLSLVWLFCQLIRLVTGADKLDIWWKEPIPTYDWSPTLPPEV